MRDEMMRAPLPVADAEAREPAMGEKGSAIDEAPRARFKAEENGSLRDPPARRVAEKLTRTQVDIDCFVDAFQAVRPDVTVNETIACLESHDWSVQKALRSMMQYDVEVEIKMAEAKERGADVEVEMKMAEARSATMMSRSR